MSRITMSQLEYLVKEINEVTGNKIEPYTKNKDGSYTTNIGNYHLQGAYGGLQLQQMHNKGGAITTPLGSGFNTKKEMYYKLDAFLMGLLSQKRGK